MTLTKELHSVVVVMYSEWYDNDKDLKAHFCVTQLNYESFILHRSYREAVLFWAMQLSFQWQLDKNHIDAPLSQLAFCFNTDHFLPLTFPPFTIFDDDVCY